jgi:hypothetical protein
MESGANETWRNPPYPNAGRKEESMDWSSIAKLEASQTQNKKGSGRNYLTKI